MRGSTLETIGRALQFGVFGDVISTLLASGRTGRELVQQVLACRFKFPCMPGKKPENRRMSCLKVSRLRSATAIIYSNQQFAGIQLIGTAGPKSKPHNDRYVNVSPQTPKSMHIPNLQQTLILFYISPIRFSILSPSKTPPETLHP